MSTILSQIRTYQGQSYKANIIMGNGYVYAEPYFWGDANTPGITMSKSEWSKLSFAKIESVATD